VLQLRPPRPKEMIFYNVGERMKRS
jgi:hypothetical protein